MQVLTVAEIGTIVNQTRKHIGMSQAELALAAGTGTRFISELENGKSTCRIEHVLNVLNALGITIELTPPEVEDNSNG